MLEIEAGKHPRIDLKSGQRYKMTHLYSSRGSFHLLRPKKHNQTANTIAENWICMGEWAFEILANIFSSKRRRPQVTKPFNPSGHDTELLG